MPNIFLLLRGLERVVIVIIRSVVLIAFIVKFHVRLLQIQHDKFSIQSYPRGIYLQLVVGGAARSGGGLFSKVVANPETNSGIRGALLRVSQADARLGPVLFNKALT